MAYAVIADITEQISEDELIQLTDDTGAGVIDNDAVNRAIADADAEVDGYTGARYGVPLSPVPTIIRKLSVDLAVYNLISRKTAPDSQRTDRYKNAIRFLEQIARGTVSLGADDPDGSPPETRAPRMAESNPERVFSRNKMDGF